MGQNACEGYKQEKVRVRRERLQCKPNTCEKQRGKKDCVEESQTAMQRKESQS